MSTEQSGIPPEIFSTIKAELQHGYQQQITIDTSVPLKGYGPWSFITDEQPGAGGEGAGPAPGPVAMAGLAS